MCFSKQTTKFLEWTGSRQTILSSKSMGSCGGVHVVGACSDLVLHQKKWWFFEVNHMSENNKNIWFD